MSDELVFVVPAAHVVAGGAWRGIRPADPAMLAAVVDGGRFAPRPAMELDPAWKQVIPYLVLRDGSRYFLMRRSTAGADARLHDRYSIGVGGHLNPGDGGIEGGLRREWREELRATWEPDFRLVGLLNDDSNEVGRVHVGVVFTAEAAGRPVAVRETDKLTGGFAEPDEVAGVVDRLETWSALVFGHLDALERAEAVAVR
ncbi:MAG TPA: NUDIX domain-containing protein [Candidatus Limnocylindrales bacterium]|nr:NUDIX domain-containing protein [Candidatus Limnocylindrales bacterium]